MTLYWMFYTITKQNLLMRRILIYILFLIASFAANAQDSIVEQVFCEIYNQHYQSAGKLLSENQNKIDSIYLTILKIDLSYWENVTGTSSPEYEIFEADIASFNINNPTTLNQKIQKLIVLSYQLRYELKRFHIFSAISTRKKTKVLFENMKKENKKLPPEYKPIFILYNSLFLYFDNYLKPFFVADKKENCRKALWEMEQLRNSPQKITKTLTNYFLGKTYLKYEDEPAKALPCFQWLIAKYPDNAKFRELLNESRQK